MNVWLEQETASGSREVMEAELRLMELPWRSWGYVSSTLSLFVIVSFAFDEEMFKESDEEFIIVDWPSLMLVLLSWCEPEGEIINGRHLEDFVAMKGDKVPRHTEGVEGVRDRVAVVTGSDICLGIEVRFSETR